MSCSVENKMVSVERIKQFTNLPSEAPWKIADSSPPNNWPSLGCIELNNLQVHNIVVTFNDPCDSVTTSYITFVVKWW